MLSDAPSICAVSKLAKPKAFRPSGNTEILIDRAIKATGLTVTDLISRCVERALPEVVREVDLERKRAADSFLKEHPPSKTK